MAYIPLLYFNGQVYQNIDTDERDEEGNPLYPDIPINDLSAMKELFKRTVRSQAKNELRKTDYFVVKAFEESLNFDSEYPSIASLRDDIRNWVSETETSIDAAETIDELLEIDILLPDSLKYDELSTTL